MLTANFVAQSVRDRELQKMSRNTFMSEDRPRVLNRGTNIKVFRLWIVSRDEIKTGWVLVVNAGRIHETAGTGRLECFRQLPDLKRTEIIGQRYEIVFLQKIDHFLLAALIGFQERRLVGRNVGAARRIGISQFRIGKERFERAIARQLRAPDRLDFRSADRQEQDMLE